MTNRKIFIEAWLQTFAKESAGPARHISTNNIRYAKDADNFVTDCLPQTDVEEGTTALEFHSISEAEKIESEL
ncbi:unnamed protein product [Hymenolepis diminuta]|uniref:DUF768 domain-containing protein n=1 Tax=Hymenolepis diminuta TaxID=6216 RepID=A0A0R3SYT1_HYMDI|nr:unnamed protein product [Hymenolepis diminuta]